MVRSRLILKCFVSRDRTLLLKGYLTYVRPLLEYGSPIWSPHFKYLVDKIESVQKYYTKRIPGMWDLPYTERLNYLGLQTLEKRRVNTDLLLCLQIINGKIDTSILHSFVRNTNRNVKIRGNSYKLNKISCKIDATKYVYSNRIVNAWNALPEHMVSGPSSTMKHFLRRS